MCHFLHVNQMPSLFSKETNLRSFIRNGVLTTAMIGLAPVQSQEGDDSFHLALLSDTHIPADKSNEYRGFRPWENLNRIIPDVIAAKPQAALINGDAARLTGEVEDYRELKQLLNPLATECPIFIGMGNHDHRENFHKVIQPSKDNIAEIENKHVVVIEHPAVRIVQLDSLLYVDKVAGLLGKAQRTWLKTFLNQVDDRPVVFFVHHTLGDRDGDLLDADRMFQILKPHPKVKAIFYGHSHVYEYGFREGKHLINLPAVGYNFNDAQPVGWINARFKDSGVDLTLNAAGGNMADHGKTTSLKWV